MTFWAGDAPRDAIGSKCGGLVQYCFSDGLHKGPFRKEAKFVVSWSTLSPLSHVRLNSGQAGSTAGHFCNTCPLKIFQPKSAPNFAQISSGQKQRRKARMELPERLPRRIPFLLIPDGVSLQFQGCKIYGFNQTYLHISTGRIKTRSPIKFQCIWGMWYRCYWSCVAQKWHYRTKGKALDYHMYVCKH